MEQNLISVLSRYCAINLVVGAYRPYLGYIKLPYGVIMASDPQ